MEKHTEPVHLLPLADILNKEILPRLYIKEGKTIAELALLFGISRGRMSKTLHHFGIPTRRTRGNGLSSPMLLTETLEDAVKRHVELAWCAGFFDGEGSIYTFRKIGSYMTCVRTKVTNVNREALERFQRTFPFTKIYADKKQKVHHSQCYTCYADSRQAETMLAQLLPYLVVRRKKAEEILAIREQEWFASQEKKSRKARERLLNNNASDRFQKKGGSEH